MVKPSAKKKAVNFLRKKFKKGLEKSCSILNISRSSFYYKHQLDDTQVIAKLKTLAESHPNRGFDNYITTIKESGEKA